MSMKIVRSHSRKRKFSFQQRETPLSKYITNRVLIVRKFNPKDKRNEINKEITDFFSLPEKYFQPNSPVTVGKKLLYSV